jgi:uncharacterized membrane protein YccC
MAVSVLGVCCSLYGTVDEPAPHVIQYTVGTVYGVAMSLAYSFLILPRVTDFPVLVAVLAPAFLFAGSLQARFPTMNMGFGITLTIPILAGLGTTYTGDFAGSLNTIIALFASLAFGLVSMTLLQTVPVDAAINRLLRPSRKDVRRHALGKGNAAAHWTNLMVDRMALLLPKMRLSKNSYSDALNDPLHHLRVGYTVGQLLHVIQHIDGNIGDETHRLLSAIAAHFDTKRRTRPVEPIELAQRIEMLMALITDSSIQDRSRLLDLLIDLQFALAPSGIQRRQQFMIVDCNIGGVFIPGLLVLAIIALVATVVVIRLFSIAGICRVFAYRPIVELATIAIIYALLLQHLPSTRGPF